MFFFLRNVEPRVSIFPRKKFSTRVVEQPGKTSWNTEFRPGTWKISRFRSWRCKNFRVPTQNSTKFLGWNPSFFYWVLGSKSEPGNFCFFLHCFPTQKILTFLTIFRLEPRPKFRGNPYSNPDFWKKHRKSIIFFLILYLWGHSLINVSTPLGRRWGAE